jgi:hypothetical protein
MSDYYKPKKISSISKNEDKISIIGKVLDTKENSFTIGDSTGKVEIFSDKKVEKDKLVRIFCSSDKGKLNADIIQDLNGLDLNLFKKIQELYYRVRINV